MMNSTCIARTAMVRKSGLGLGLDLKKLGLFTSLPFRVQRSSSSSSLKNMDVGIASKSTSLTNTVTSNNNEVGALAVDEWDVTFGTARRSLDGAAARPGPSSLYQM